MSGGCEFIPYTSEKALLSLKVCLTQRRRKGWEKANDESEAYSELG